MHLNYLCGILADATAAPSAAPSTAPAGTPGQPASPMQQLFGSPIILFVVMIVMLYVLMIRPQSQQRKKQAQMLSALKSGDKVCTAAGIVGVVITVKDKTVNLRSADAKFEVTKSSITEILESGAATESEK